MAFVLDASVTACWAFHDEDHPDASAALERMRTEEAVVPDLWWFEIRNILIVYERRNRITESEANAFLKHVSRLRIQIDQLSAEGVVLDLARSHRLSIYDAAYLALAQQRRLALATLDVQLRKAATAEGVPLVLARRRRSRDSV